MRGAHSPLESKAPSLVQQFYDLLEKMEESFNLKEGNRIRSEVPDDGQGRYHFTYTVPKTKFSPEGEFSIIAGETPGKDRYFTIQRRVGEEVTDVTLEPFRHGNSLNYVLRRKNEVPSQLRYTSVAAYFSPGVSPANLPETLISVHGTRDMYPISRIIPLGNLPIAGDPRKMEQVIHKGVSYYVPRAPVRGCHLMDDPAKLLLMGLDNMGMSGNGIPRAMNTSHTAFIVGGFAVFALVGTAALLTGSFFAGRSNASA
jgi:hypothetical protein